MSRNLEEMKKGLEKSDTDFYIPAVLEEHFNSSKQNGAMDKTNAKEHLHFSQEETDIDDWEEINNDDCKTMADEPQLLPLLNSEAKNPHNTNIPPIGFSQTFTSCSPSSSSAVSVVSDLDTINSIKPEELNEAKLEDKDAQFKLGCMYLKGQGDLPPDYIKAHEYLKKAANQDHAKAQYELGDLYYYGHGVAQSYAIAREWYEKAAKQENASAQSSLGFLYCHGHGIDQSYVIAREWYVKAANQGNVKAQLNLGFLYYYGHSVAQSYAIAREWYEKAAKQENARAQYNLGVLYGNGKGVDLDYAIAREWYEKAAKQEDASAQYNLGVFYYNGQGVDQDYAQARVWWEKAANQGDAEAQAALELLQVKHKLKP